MRKKLMLEMYQDVLESLPPTQRCMEIHQKFGDEREKFLKNLEEQNSRTLEDLTDIIYDANEEINKQMFCTGMTMGIKLIIEAVYDKE